MYISTIKCSVSVFLAMFFIVAWPAHARKKNDKTATQGYMMLVEPDAMPEPLEAQQPVKQPQVARQQQTKSGKINTRYREGIDVSHYQGSIDWGRVAKQQVSYAYIKATEGAGLVDEYYEQNIREARKAGLSVGAYHFYRPNISWRQQFDNLTSVVKREQQDLVPIIDIETTGNVPQEKFIRDLSSFIKEVTKHYGKKPLLYTFHNFYNRYLSGQFHNYHWMIARYKEDEPVLNDGMDYVIWQYSSSGRIDGIRGNVDRSCLMGTHSLSLLQL